MTLLAELDKTIVLLEQRIPASQSSPANERRKNRLRLEVARYFRALDKAFPYDQLAVIYNANVIQESISSDTRDILDPLLATFDATLTTTVSGQLAETYISGSAEMITWGKTQAGIPIAFEGPPVSEAVNWANTRGAQLVTQMDTETKKRLAHTISEGIKNKRGVPGLARDIKKTFSSMSRNRSLLIARTETANALSQASLDRMKDMDIDGKEWVTVGDANVSEDCEANEAQGVIPVNQAFSGGTMGPPQHPDCRCSLAPARLR